MRSKEIDNYLEDLEPTQKEAFQKVREFLHRRYHHVYETLEYKVPQFRFEGGKISLEPHEDHVAMYVDPTILEKYRSKFGKVTCKENCLLISDSSELPFPVLAEMMDDLVNPQ